MTFFCESTPPFRILFKKTSDLAARMHLAPIICPQGVRIWLLFHRKFINCLLKHCAIWKQGQFKQSKLLRYLRIGRKLVRKIAQKLRKKLLETKKVARNTISCQKVGEQLVESSREKGEGGEGWESTQ